MELVVLAAFCLLLLGSIAFHLSLIGALLAGLVLFLLYGRMTGASLKKLCFMVWEGIWAAKNIVVTLFLIGILTSFWRAGGTIPSLVTYAATWIRPEGMLLLTFLLNSGVSFLVGSSFATAATMGVITVTLATGMGISPWMAGGAMLSGVYFGDRASPVSTSALLVSELTQTDLYDNVRRMFHTSVVPLLLSCLFYGILGWYESQSHVTLWQTSFDLADYFVISWPMLLPAVIILVMGFFHISVKKTMIVSILCSAFCAVYFQHVPFRQLFYIGIWGFHTHQSSLEILMGGGGLISMGQVVSIICISSSYAGIFHGTGMLHRLEMGILKLSQKIGAFGALLVTSLLNSAIACNQTLAIMMSYQLCQKLFSKKQDFAIGLENSVVVLAPLIPWSIAGGVPLDVVGAPSSSFPWAIYLCLLPLWRWIRSGS